MFAGLENPIHLLVILVVVLIVFGPKRLPELGRTLGGGMRAFKSSLDGQDEERPGQHDDREAAVGATAPTAESDGR